MTIQCVNCHEELGPEKKIQPTQVDDGDGDPEAKKEWWCPPCFVWHRALLDPARHGSDPLQPLSAKCCAACGWTTVDFGRGCCGMCGMGIRAVMGPKPGVGLSETVAKEMERRRLAKAALLKTKVAEGIVTRSNS